MKKRLYINTMGCQMNVYDSQQMQHRLASQGYELTQALESADVILINTCTIRAKAEQKAFSFLGRLAPLKARKPELIIGVGGCLAQQQGRRILSRMPCVDLVFGTHAVARLPQLIERIRRSRCRLADVETSERIDAGDYISEPYPQSDISAFVTIMRGCDNYCTYCVVPYVRGRESSRPPEDILTEIRHLAAQGVREVTLLGQNVNSYGLKEDLCTFDELLTAINNVEGLERIRFTTSHPKDLSESLIQCFTRLEKLCHHIHLPVQSGSDAVLKRMNRHYTVGHYLEKVERLKRACPDIALTSDIIVGFPGETASDFNATLDLMRRVEFDGLFAFIYSDRPNAPAARFGGKVDEEVKKDRLQQILNCQEEISRRRNKALVGTVQKVLVDGVSRSNSEAERRSEDPRDIKYIQWAGRTQSNRIVHFNSDNGEDRRRQVLTGRMMDIMIEKALPHCLWGQPLSP